MVIHVNSVSMKDCNSQSLRDAALSYDSMGYKILSLKPRSKEVESSNWSDPDYRDYPVHWQTKGNENNNIGMPLGRNNFYVIDIDNKEDYLKSTSAIADVLVERTGVDEMFWESKTIGISSGKPGSGKLIFRVPEWASGRMKCHKVNWQNKEKKLHSVVEFRCGNGVQDVMPPSIHPSGTTYQFVGGDDALPMPADLLYLACCWDTISEKMLSANPDYVKPVRIKSSTGKPYVGENYIEMWCDKEHLPSWLTRYGYTPFGNNRYLSPHSTSGNPGIVLFDDGKRFYSYGSSDPFCDNKAHDAYDLLVYYEYNGDSSRAYKERVLEDLHVKRFLSLQRNPTWDEE